MLHKPVTYVPRRDLVTDCKLHSLSLVQGEDLEIFLYPHNNTLRLCDVLYSQTSCVIPENLDSAPQTIRNKINRIFPQSLHTNSGRVYNNAGRRSVA
jgi:hypothetical protein